MKFFDYFKGIAFGLILAGAVSYVSAQSGSWTPAACPPPGCNTEAPINVSLNPQIKEGPLTVGGLTVGDGGIAIVDGTHGMGKVLTSDEGGLASWQEPTGGGETSVHVKVYPKEYILGLSGGVGNTSVVLGAHTYCAQINDQHGHDTDVGTQAQRLTVNPLTGVWTYNLSMHIDFPAAVCFDITGASVTYEIAS